MPDRPYVLLSVAASVDGYIDDNTDQRLLLSNDEDFDRVDDVRAGVDAILVGANTIRRDNPRLLVRSDDRRKRRVDAGLAESPIKVTISAGGDLDPTSKFFATGDVDKVVYVPTSAVEKAAAAVGAVSHVVDAGAAVDLGFVLSDLAQRGVKRLMVEGGGTMHTQFLSAGLADEIHLVIAPFFVGDSSAPRFVSDAQFPQSPSSRMALTEVKQIGDVVLLRYLPKVPTHA
ncbi:5-amino-6-(5-phosphoribosylamino)uracil reductase [Kribbella pratensis]|uniref:5-amino-6-(5-phosphoribosylamino)uracil reductase n=1 Tax=Kribbella pratensis TaxID=2512112 RepID=A0ABY2F8E5_9ACTN|nr:dihydrofolate reductase family protein [Kribbella pratensis]TDW84532.1 5-amino-6-(5-phosphoribosylamino)uracil reductase [Kribbella pratensis]